tara:strand:- start:102 stop:353 length:252 start_codon:yes stop_codon:yes gene_type:complete
MLTTERFIFLIKGYTTSQTAMIQDYEGLTAYLTTYNQTSLEKIKVYNPVKEKFTRASKDHFLVVLSKWDEGKAERIKKIINYK